MYREELGQEVIDATWKGDTARVQRLLDRGADPNVRRDRKDRFRGLPKLMLEWVSPDSGWTPLMIASMENHTAIQDALIRRGARVDARGWLGSTALSQAVLKGHVQAIQVLLRRGAPVDQAGVFGNTPLMTASGPNLWSSQPATGARVIGLLLDAGADVNGRGVRGRTALMMAAKAGNEKAVKLLLQRGADPRIQDADGHTAEWWAKRGGHERLAQAIATHRFPSR